jgi:hypothetical protein
MTIAVPDQMPTVDDIVSGLRDHVWTLLKAEKLDAVMVLLEAALDDFLRATTVPQLSSCRELTLWQPC